MKAIVLAWPAFFFVLLSAQTPTTATQLPAIAMPSDRAEDSYALYSRLIPLGETAGPGWPHELWLIEDTTIGAVGAGQPCIPATDANGQAGLGMNPHQALQPTEDRLQDYKELLQDFDVHCHDRIRLDASAWKLAVPVHLLTPEEQEEFRTTRFGKPGTNAGAVGEKYKGAPAVYAFSEVYFNAHHTVAMIYATHWCGGLCGQGIWVCARENGGWKELPWSTASWIS